MIVSEDSCPYTDGDILEENYIKRPAPIFVRRSFTYIAAVLNADHSAIRDLIYSDSSFAAISCVAAVGCQSAA